MKTSISPVVCSLAFLSLVAGAATSAVDLSITGGTVSSVVNGLNDTQPAATATATSFAIGGSAASATYSRLNDAATFRFGVEQAISFSGGDIAAGQKGTLQFQLNEPASYLITAQNDWSASSFEAVIGQAFLQRDSAPAETLYSEYDHIPGFGGTQILQGIGEGLAIVPTFGSTTGLLEPGAYTLSYEFDLYDETHDFAGNADLTGSFLFQLAVRGAPSVSESDVSKAFALVCGVLLLGPALMRRTSLRTLRRW